MSTQRQLYILFIFINVLIIDIIFLTSSVVTYLSKIVPTYSNNFFGIVLNTFKKMKITFSRIR